MADPAVLSAVVIALGSLAVAVVTRNQNIKGAAATNALSSRVVDREDFQAIVEELRQSLVDVRAELADVRLELKSESAARERAERRAGDAERRAVRLERRVSQLEQVLREHDIPVPPLAT